MSLNENQPVEGNGPEWIRSGIPDASKAGVEEQSLGITEAKADNDNSPPQNTLLPCPFCGEVEYLRHAQQVSGHSRDIETEIHQGVDGVYAIVCRDCGARGPETLHDDKAVADVRWNQRVTPSVVAGVEEKRWHYEAFDGHHVCRAHPDNGSTVLFTTTTYEDARKAIAFHNATLGEPREKEDLGGKEPPTALTHVLQMESWRQFLATMHDALTVAFIAGCVCGGKNNPNWRSGHAENCSAGYFGPRIEEVEAMQNQLTSVGASNAVLPHPVSESPVGSTATGVSALKFAIKILLNSHGCWCDGEPEIPEEISGQFDITLDDARFIIESLSEPKELEEEKHD